MTVIYQPAGMYRYDPSQAVRGTGCGIRQYRTMATVLSTFPRDAFDYVWMIDPPRFDGRLLGDAVLVFRGSGTLLYRLGRRDAPKVAP
jgi:hypothetical protein